MSVLNGAMKGCGRVAVVLALSFGAGQLPAEAQVGLTSGAARVTLIARSAPQGSIPAVSAPERFAQVGSLRETAVNVKLSANTSYRLVVRGTAANGTKVWVRSVTGEFQELTEGTAVTVARDAAAPGIEQQVQFRIEGSDGNAPGALPVRYDLVIAPTI